MPEDIPPLEQVQVAVRGEDAFLRASGRVTLRVSPAVKDFARVAFDRGCRRLVCDLGACSSMDSTFMGVLAGLAARRGVVVILFNLSPKLLDLVTTLGLDQVAQCHAAGAAPPDLAPLLEEVSRMEALVRKPADATETAEVMLEAHETLANLSPLNRPRFQDVLTYLREDLARRRGGAGSP